MVCLHAELLGHEGDHVGLADGLPAGDRQRLIGIGFVHQRAFDEVFARHVVEDALMIRMLLEDMLAELGYTVAAEAGRIEEALQAAKTADFDLAILDVNLDGEPVLPVADALVARGMPFVFATGYGERGVPGPYRDRPMLKKPFQMEGLKQMLQTALEGEKN